MADSKTQELQNQSDLQAQINKILESRNAILAAQQKALSTQVQMAVDMCKALKCEELDLVEARLKTTRDAMSAAATEAGKLKGELGDVAAAGQNAGSQGSSALDKLNDSFDASNLTLAGFGAGILQFGGIFMQTFKNVISMAGGLLASLGKLGFAIITLPFKLLGGLFDLAQSSGGGGPSPIAQALEKIRGELGGLNTAVGKAAVSALPQFRKQLKDMAGTGLRVAKVFGQGREGLAKAMEYNVELIKALGPAAEHFTGVLKKSAVELAMYRKGLGISAESQAQIMKLAEATGKDPAAAMHDFATVAINMGEAFGISAAVIGKDMAEMKADFANFGTLSVRELSQAAVYAHKLGIEVKALQGVIGAFDDFETAAQNAAKLSQAFGMNVDAMKMLNAANPAERLSMLQQAFKETGKSIESMSRQEIKLLAAQSGLTEEQSLAAFSQKGLSQSYDQITKAGAKAEKKQLTQAEAMSKLADSIERVFGGGGGSKFQGFFDAFSKGFQDGILRSKELRGLFRDIRKSLRTVFLAGRSVGKMFAELFPGFQQMVAGLRDVFNPKRFREMMDKVKDIFKQFFLDLRTDPKAGVEKFVERMKEAFKSLFQGQGSGVNTFMEGGKTFLKTIGAIFMAILPMVLDGLIKAVNAIADFIAAPPGIPGAVSALGDQLLDALIRVFDVLKDRLWPPVKRMFMALWEKIGPWVEKTVEVIFYASLFKAFARGAVGALGGAAVGVLKNVLLKTFTTTMVQTGEAAAASTGAGAAAQTATSFMPSIGQFLVAVGAVLLVFAGVVAIYKIAGLTPLDALGLGIIMVSLATSTLMISAAVKMIPPGAAADASGLATVLAIMTASSIVVMGVMAILSMIDTPNLGQIAAFTAVILTLTLATLPIILAATIIGAMKQNVAQAVEGMGIIGVFMVAVGVVGVVVSSLLSLFSNPTGIAALMEGISSLIWATLGMLPAAFALGMVMTSGIGAIGLAPILLGFALIAGLATGLVGTLLPAVTMLANIRIADPESFKAVTGALVDIMQAVNGFVGALSGLAYMMRPTFAQMFDGDAFQGNINAMKGLVDTILKSGVTDIIDKLATFAQTANIKQGTGEAISAIAAVLGAVGTLLKAFSPDGEVFSKLAEEAGPEWYEMISPMGLVSTIGRANNISTIMDGMKEMQNGALGQLQAVLPSVATGIQSLLSSIGTIPAGIKDVGPFISGFASVLTAVAAIMKAMSPSDKAFEAVTEAADTYGEDATAVMNSAFAGMRGISTGIVDLLTDIKDPLVSMMQGMMEALQPIITAAASVDPQVISGLGQILSGVMGAVSSIMDTFISMMDVANERAGAYEDAFAQESAFDSILTNITGLFATMGPSFLSLVEPMRTMVNAVIAIAQGITNTRGLKARIEAVTAALAAVGQMSQIFGPSGPFYGAPPPNSTVPVSLITGMVTMMGEVARQILVRGGPLQRVVDAFDAIVVKNPRSLKSKAEALTGVFAGIQALSTAMTTMNATGTQGIGALAAEFNRRLGDTETITTALESMVDILNVVPRNMENVSSRVQAMVQAYTALHTALSTPLGDANIAAIVRLNDSLDGQRNLTVRHESLPPINLTVTVHVDSEAVGEAILNNERDIRTTAGRRFAITGPNPA